MRIEGLLEQFKEEKEEENRTSTQKEAVVCFQRLAGEGTGARVSFPRTFQWKLLPTAFPLLHPNSLTPPSFENHMEVCFEKYSFDTFVTLF